MASQIENIYAKQAEDQLKKILDGLTSIHKKQIELNNNAIDFYGGRTASSVSDMKKVEVSMQKLQAQAERNRTAELKLATQREKAFDKYEAQLSKEQAKLQASQNLYNKTQQQLNKVQSAYNNLAAKKERYNNLSLYEEGRLKTLQLITEKYNTTLKAVDATVGKHTRNVGNYASAFNPVSNSITQLTREMPAFANSVQTGFMAISNNLPIFFDSMQQAIAQQKELQKQGLPSKNALQILAGGLFTLGTALSIGVTLLTVYGAEVVNFITGAKKKKEAIEAEKKALEEKQKVEEQARETTAGFQSGELSRSKILFENAKNLTLTYKERKNAINELRERYPDYLKNLTDEQILAGNTADAENELNNALIKRGVALAAQEMLQKNLTDELKLRLKNAELLKQSLEDQKTIIEQGNEIVIYTDKQKAAEQQKEALARKSRKDQYNNYVQSIIALRDERQAIIATYKENAKYLGAVKENTSATKKNTKATKDNVKAKNDVRFDLIGSVEWFEKLKSALELEQKQLSQNSEKWQDYQKKIDQAQKSIDAITKASKELKEEEIELPGLKDSQFVKDLEKAKELLNFNEDFQKGFIDDFVSNSGFDKVFELIENFDKLKVDAVSTALAISEAFQQAFNTISQMSDVNYQRMYDNLERQRDTSILFAGESATARAEVERVYEERRKRIQRQQAESQKKMAIFNAVVDTAQGVVGAIARADLYPYNFVLAGIIGAIGAAQVAMISSQPIPQFAIGTQNAPEGLAWTDERGAELHTDKNGKIKDLGSSKGARLKKLEKGDKIYTASQTKKILDLYSFNKEYDNIMLTNGIAPAPQVGQTINLDPIRNELISLKNVVANKSEVTIMNNESGTRYYERVNGQRRELVNSVLTMKSRSVR